MPAHRSTACYNDLVAENTAYLQRFISSNYYASENLAKDSSLTWEQSSAGFAPVGMLSFVNTATSNATRRSTMACCEAVVSSLDTAIQAIAADSSITYGSLESDLVGTDLVVDAQVLETIQPRTKEFPDEYMALKHVTYQSAVPSQRNGEDYVLLETVGRDVDPDGFPFAFRMLRSVDLPGIYSNSLNNALGDDTGDTPMRGQIRTFVVILSETKFDGMLRMQVWLDVKLPSQKLSCSFSTLHDALSLGLRYRNIIERHFVSSIRDMPASAAEFATVHLVPLVESRSTKCQVCEHKLGFFSRQKRRSCSLCKVALCGTCAKSTDVCSWKLCMCCYSRHYKLFSRQIMSKIASSKLNRLTMLARRTPGYETYRKSVIGARASLDFGSSGRAESDRFVQIPGRRSNNNSTFMEKSGVRTSSSDSTRSSVSSIDSLLFLHSQQPPMPSQRPTLTELDLINTGIDQVPYHKPRVTQTSAEKIVKADFTVDNDVTFEADFTVDVDEMSDAYRVSTADWRLSVQNLDMHGCVDSVEDDGEFEVPVLIKQTAKRAFV
ncbi:hypothetical protein Poli38472_011440 [Pythium oligandrum]|uniref:FYVE-type domain-containing protein n=1 Tax=Pythium oligandrum TaxID=41045 RepID=A0A8K1FI34_PYTOL|nr:hypothetical protein Poli38472_011440 [Pythium oligandrum]|eukprot:TMW64560.1 hypothetical protein Poli38472_011440 [Pythium oligandrum]